MTSKPRLVVWYFSDNKPGHENQSKALIDGLKQHRSVEVVRLLVADCTGSYLALLTGSWQAMCDHPIPNIVIGAGHTTHVWLLAAQRCFGAKTVVIMSPTLPPTWFDVIIAPAHDNITGRNTVSTHFALVPTITCQPTPNRGLILIGGPSKHFKFDPDWLARAVTQLTQAQPSVNWQLSDSRRTPRTLLGQLRDLSLPNLTLSDVNSQPTGWLKQQYQAASEIWITSDSASMLAEALATNANVGVIELDSKRRLFKKTNKFSFAIEQLKSQRGVGYLSPQDLAFAAPRPTPQNDCRKIAAQVLTLLNL